MIKELKAQEKFKGILLVSNVTRGITNVGVPYLTLTFQDASGQIEGRKWNAVESDYNTFAVGSLVNIEADVLFYRTTLQLKVISGTSVSDKDVNIFDFVMAAPVKKEILQKKLLEYINQIKNPDIKKVVESIVSENLVSIVIYPAASKHHHEYVSGLLHHTVGMLDSASALCSVYPSLNRDLLIGGAVLHDIGKIRELSGPIAPKYTEEGRLIGHISIMHAYFKEKANKLKIDPEVSLVLEHMILSHHGEQQFGSPVVPAIKEAEVLNFIDNLDARINMMDKALSQVEEGEFTSKVFPLDERAFYKPKIK